MSNVVVFPIRRAKQQSVKIDWADLIKQINEAGVSYTEIAELTGVERTFANKIASDNLPSPDAWDKAAALIDLWLMVRDENNIRKPVIGAQE